MKKYLAIAALIGLVFWGFYDVGGNNSKNPDAVISSAGVSPNSVQGSELRVGLEEGNLAPDFELQTIEGKSIKLSSLRGKKVIVNFWSTWCPPCRLEMPEMEKFYTKNKNEGIAILAVNLTKAEKSREDVPAFIKTYGITFPVLLDENSDTAQLYNVSSIPASFILDTQGVIQQKIVGPMTYEAMEKMLGAVK